MAERKTRTTFRDDFSGIDMHLVRKNDDGKFDVLKTLSFNVSDLPEDIQRRLVLHGLKQKLGDAYADPSVNPEEAATSVFAQLRAGEWSTRGEAGPKAAPIHVQALARLNNISEEEAVQRWESKDEATQAAIKKHPKVKAMVEQIKKERAAERAKNLQKMAKEAGELEF